MASFVEYRKNAAACARLARIAPTESSRASFAAASKHWASLYRLAAGNSTGVDCSVASGRLETARTIKLMADERVGSCSLLRAHARCARVSFSAVSPHRA
jgi:hypothetical protein